MVCNIHAFCINLNVQDNTYLISNNDDLQLFWEHFALKQMENLNTNILSVNFLKRRQDKFLIIFSVLVNSAYVRASFKGLLQNLGWICWPWHWFVTQTWQPQTDLLHLWTRSI